MKKITTKKIVINGIMIALVFLATYFTKIPIPLTQGYFNIGDTVILLAAVLLGRGSGFMVGAIGSALADLAGGYYLFVPLTFLVKGLEGFVAGAIAVSLIAARQESGSISGAGGSAGSGGAAGVVSGGVDVISKKAMDTFRRVVAVIAGPLVMVAGYFIGEAYLLGLFDSTFGFTVAVTELPLNLIQGGISAIIAYLLSSLLYKTERSFLER